MDWSLLGRLWKKKKQILYLLQHKCSSAVSIAIYLEYPRYTFKKIIYVSLSLCLSLYLSLSLYLKFHLANTLLGAEAGPGH